VTLQDKYYSDKLEIKRGDAAGRRRVVDAFVEGLHWVLEYYYRCAVGVLHAGPDLEGHCRTRASRAGSCAVNEQLLLQ
jgi:Xrn1 helical domain